MSTHERLDLDYWMQEFPLKQFIEEQRAQCQRNWMPFSEDWLPEAGVISSPAHLAIVQHLRNMILEQGHDLGPASPVDVFLWRFCEFTEGPITRIGGKPFRNPRKPWPTAADGRLLPFLAQISFLDSMDLVPADLPGDVLSMYGLWSGSKYIDMESLVFEWASLDGGQTHTNHDVPEWPFCAEGVIHRTVCYPHCDDSIHDLGIDVPDVLQATQIGRYPFRIQDDDDDGNDSIMVASFSSLQPEVSWPFINFPEVPRYTHSKGHELDLTSIFELMMGDMGSIYIFKDENRKYTSKWDCY